MHASMKTGLRRGTAERNAPGRVSEGRAVVDRYFFVDSLFDPGPRHDSPPVEEAFGGGVDYPEQGIVRS